MASSLSELRLFMVCSRNPLICSVWALDRFSSWARVVSLCRSVAVSVAKVLLAKHIARAATATLN
ncbi:hypothetical protein D3C80_1968880 [compost metagenome]